MFQPVGNVIIVLMTSSYMFFSGVFFQSFGRNSDEFRCQGQYWCLDAIIFAQPGRLGGTKMNLPGFR